MPPLGSISGCAPRRGMPTGGRCLSAWGCCCRPSRSAAMSRRGTRDLGPPDNPNYAQISLKESNLTDQKSAEIGRIARIGAGVYLVLTMLPFAGRGARGWLYRRRRTPLLTHSSGRTVPLLAGATVLETLRENGIPHASVCGGRARCTTCRILVTKGLGNLPEPSGLEAKALARIGATPGMRLACQICPTAHISVMPLLAA